MEKYDIYIGNNLYNNAKARIKNLGPGFTDFESDSSALQLHLLASLNFRGFAKSHIS